jgi:GntR family transcriptional regulator, carbon starvation induced regulator
VLAESFRGQPVAGDHKLLFELVLVKDAKRAKMVIRNHVISGLKHIRKSRNIL